MSKNKYIYRVGACAAALLVGYTGCRGLFSLERWRVQEDDIPEFVLYSEKDCNLSESVVTVFSHGYADTYQQVNRYVCGRDHYGDICDKDLVLKPYVTFNYPDAAKTVLPVKASRSSMGQDGDIEKLYDVIEAVLPQCKQVIGVGCSRGSAALINLFERYPGIRLSALVLESPFDCMEHVIDTIIDRSRLSWIPGMRSKAFKLFNHLFPLYNNDGPKPIEAVKHIPYHIPVLISCSREDGLIKAEGSIALYNELLMTGHPNVYLFVADYGKHSKIASGQSGEAYQNVVHAFYQTYNLPHNPEYALAGQDLLEKSQPTLAETELIFS